MHVGTGVAHGADHPVQGNEVLAVTAQGHLCGVDGFHGGDCVAFDARHLHQTANRVAGEAEVVFQADFGGVFQLFRACAQHLCQPRGGHGAGRADFALAADFGPGDRCVFLAQDANGGCTQEERDHVVVRRIGIEFHVVMQHRRDDARCAVGRRRDHAPACRVFFVHGKGVQVDPFHR
ncbi:hypothetical protein D9M71_272940 [compost metagenome]